MKNLSHMIESYQRTINKIVSEVIQHETKMKLFFESIPKTEAPQEKMLVPLSEKYIRQAALDLCNEHDHNGFIAGAKWYKSQITGEKL